VTNNRVKAKLQSGETAYGVWLNWLDPNLIEFYGYLGFDYVIIDAEHLAVDRANCQEFVRACDVVGLTSIVRPPDNDPGTILGFLDLGAQGIYAPHVSSARDAEDVVSAVKYAPVGHRSMHYPRPMKYGLTDDPPNMYRQANEDTMVIVLVEEPEGLENLDEILTVEGVDVVGIGDGDLSHGLGFVGDKSNPKLRAVIDDAEARVVASSKVTDAVVTSTEEALTAVSRGARMISLSDQDVIEQAGRQFLSEVRA
jgi:staphyloferrin B biosynthesis citrate synthase